MSAEVIIDFPNPPRLSPLFRMQYEPVQESWVLLYPEGMVQLNVTAAEILRRCDGKTDFVSIVQKLEKMFSTSGISSEVAALLREGHRRGWIV